MKNIILITLIALIISLAHFGCKKSTKNYPGLYADSITWTTTDNLQPSVGVSNYWQEVRVLNDDKGNYIERYNIYFDSNDEAHYFLEIGYQTISIDWKITGNKMIYHERHTAKDTSLPIDLIIDVSGTLTKQ